MGSPGQERALCLPRVYYTPPRVSSREALHRLQHWGVPFFSSLAILMVFEEFGFSLVVYLRFPNC